MLYLDHAATTRVRPETRAAMAPFLDGVFGNPSGVHSVSRQAKNALETAREEAAELIGAAHPLEIVFTGGGTEADNLAVVGSALAGGDRRGVVTTAVEHEAVLESVDFLERLGCRVSRVGVDRSGKLDLDDLVSHIGGDTAVVSVMAGNNETGVLFPLDDIAASVRATAPGVLFHTDAVQAVITEETTVRSTHADMISMAAHKFGGPKGVGLLYVPREVELEPVLHGGGQELGRRSGTHNVAAIVGMIAALRVTVADREETRSRIARIRDEFEVGLLAAVPDLVVTGAGRPRLVQHSHLRIPGVAAETLLIRLDQEGVAAAAGSACNSGAVEVSHVLDAMGMTEQEAAECVRFTFGWSSEANAGTRAARLVSKLAKELR